MRDRGAAKGRVTQTGVRWQQGPATCRMKSIQPPKGPRPFCLAPHNSSTRLNPSFVPLALFLFHFGKDALKRKVLLFFLELSQEGQDVSSCYFEALVSSSHMPGGSVA